MPLYTVRPGRHVTVDGFTHGPGFTFEAADTAVTAALAAGDVAPAVPKQKKPPRESAKPQDAAVLEEAILLASATLPEGSFTKNGAPDVKALEAVLGYDITAAERDAAWAARV